MNIRAHPHSTLPGAAQFAATGNGLTGASRLSQTAELPPEVLLRAGEPAPKALARTAQPLILTLDMFGLPHRWVSWQHACFYYAKDLVAWAAGEVSFVVRGGVNRMTGLRSQIVTNSIIAIRGKALAGKSLRAVPPLSNRELFNRDRHVCAYCGHTLSSARLTRDHIVPVSQGGTDNWMNVVTACRSCNQAKSGRTPEQSGMELLYAPYVPNKAEYLILCNRQILADQMELLLKHVAKGSRMVTLH